MGASGRGERRELGFLPDGFSWDWGGLAVGRADVAGAPEFARTASYPPYIWDGNEGCPSARAFESSDWVDIL